MTDQEILRRIEELIDTTSPEELDHAIWDWYYEMKKATALACLANHIDNVASSFHHTDNRHFARLADEAIERTPIGEEISYEAVQELPDFVREEG